MEAEEQDGVVLCRRWIDVLTGQHEHFVALFVLSDTVLVNAFGSISTEFQRLDITVISSIILILEMIQLQSSARITKPNGRDMYHYSNRTIV